MKVVEEFSRMELISLARTSLVRARLARQEAHTVREFDGYQDSISTPTGLSSRLEKLAREQRLMARRALQAVEIENEAEHLSGGIIMPLKECLDGKGFADWSTYIAQYGAHFFNGVDPER